MENLKEQEKVNKFCVYKHTSPSGKVYIGITGQKPKERWQEGNGYKRNPIFYNAIKKYGWNNFTHEIIMSKLSREQAVDMERFYIYFYHSNDRKYGYNGTFGGDGILGFNHTEEAKRKIGIASHNRERSLETRAKISKAHLGMKGTKWTEEEYKIHSEKAKRQWQDADYRKYMLERIKEANTGRKSAVAKKVRCVETQEIFESVFEASKFYNIQACHISSCCKGKRQTCGKKHWEYV